jgi:hypothetical protein
MAQPKGKYTGMVRLMIDERGQKRCRFCGKDVPLENEENIHKRCEAKQRKIDADLGRYRNA